jgi:hypothetical protein
MPSQIGIAGIDRSRGTKTLCAKEINHRPASELSSDAKMVYRGDAL